MYPYTTDVTPFLVNQATAQGMTRDAADEWLTPDNKLSEGIDSVQTHQPAPFLPLIRYEKRYRTHVVISSQTPVAIATLKDGSEFLVPAGYALALETNDTDIKYTKEDVKNGVLDAEGNPVTDGQAVITSVKAAGIKISAFVGIINYNAFRHMGGDGTNPTLYNHRNYNPQPAVSFNMQYTYEYPLVKDADELAKAPMDGISVFLGEGVLAGQFVTYDKFSNFVVAEAGGFGYGATKPEHILGQILKTTVLKDPTTGQATEKGYNHLDKVVYAPHLGYDATGLNNMPGYRNGGLTAKVFYANGYGLVTFKLNTR